MAGTAESAEEEGALPAAADDDDCWFVAISLLGPISQQTKRSRTSLVHQEGGDD
jgi:hypothetical protein